MLVAGGSEYKKRAKGEINERIRFFCRMQAQGRTQDPGRMQTHAGSVSNGSVGRKAHYGGCALDDGTYNVDSLDAQEYAVEPYMRQMLRI